ncbi:hypothetical protein GQ43DRAFT_472515 [Delitschia confertaspora ATCC 74209]|uniref:Heterokaryon incompatibility domain-containing protein n=1 Tax=Delitschia confertaspora ATCC 74209 TaxID=1513339 RepID=A0A9P4MRP1_9PLEO|nr:hypothetical protein GQ43DRAFT_472515 [Delitschia confertaspora ATCC 74209]
MNRLKQLLRRRKESSRPHSEAGRSTVEPPVELPVQTPVHPPVQSLVQPPAQETPARGRIAALGSASVSERNTAKEANVKPFQYMALKHVRNFRILHLQRRFSQIKSDYKGVALQGSLKEASLDSAPEYQALSYTWGAPNFTEDIIIDGKLLKITPNCASALRRMLRGKADRLVWVDSICINQGSEPEAIEERSGQVGMMDEIYRLAVQVNVFLGDGDAASDIACQAFKSLQKWYLLAKVPGPQQGIGQRKYNELAEDVLKTTAEYPYGKLYGVFRLPWFRRAWVLQEVAMGQKVFFYCGDYLMHFGTLVIGADFTRLPYSKLDSTAHHWKMYLEHHHALQEFIRRHDEGEPISNFNLKLQDILFIPALNLEATNPKDKVYALFGICKRFGFDLPVPDYKKHIAVIYTEAARALIRCDQSLGFLSMVEGSSSSSLGLPSWVPNFSGSIHSWSQSNPPHLSMAMRENIRVSGLTQWQYELQPDGRGLKVKGRRLDQIAVVGKPWEIDNSTNLLGLAATQTGQYAESLMSCIGDWFDVLHDPAQHPSPESARTTVETMARVLTKDRPRDPYPATSFDQMVEYLAILVTCSKARNTPHGTSLFHPRDSVLDIRQVGGYTISTGMHRVIAQFVDAAWKTVFRTWKGYVGVGTHGSQLGDAVVVFHGSSSPCIVRPYGSSDINYRYVGSAYVDGIMKGEFWRTGSERDDEWFVLG